MILQHFLIRLDWQITGLKTHFSELIFIFSRKDISHERMHAGLLKFADKLQATLHKVFSWKAYGFPIKQVHILIVASLLFKFLSV